MIIVLELKKLLLWDMEVIMIERGEKMKGLLEIIKNKNFKYALGLIGLFLWTISIFLR